MLGNLDKYQIILASNSPRRKELMSGLGVDYVVRTLPDVDESYPADLAGAAIPEYISRKRRMLTGVLCNRGTVDYSRYDCLARW